MGTEKIRDNWWWSKNFPKWVRNIWWRDYKRAWCYLWESIVGVPWGIIKIFAFPIILLIDALLRIPCDLIKYQYYSRKDGGKS